MKNSKSKPLVIVLLGPTASGKTELAIQIAQALKLDIHNIDSRQIYKKMDIGTAKPSLEQQKLIKHFLIDLTEPSEPMTLHQFQEEAMKSLQTNLKKQNIGFLVGGSGLYLKALISGLKPPEVAPQEKLRNQLRSLDNEECHELLKQCDPIAADKINVADSSRTIRALEVFYATGQTLSSQQSSSPPPWEFIELGLNPENLHNRIIDRTRNIFKNGLIEETEALIKDFGKELPLLQTIGYKEACNVIESKSSIEEAIDITTIRTNQFAKRQRTWFKGQHKPKWLNAKNPLSEALSFIQNVIG